MESQNLAIVTMDNYVSSFLEKGQFIIGVDEQGRFNISNLDEFLKEISNLHDQLEALDYTDDDRQKLMSVRANFNKISTSLTSLLKEQKDFYFGQLDKDIKTIKAQTSLFSSEIKKLLDETEARFRENKRLEVEKVFNDAIEYNVELKPLIKLNDIFNNSWLNRTTTLKKIVTDIDFIVKTIDNLLKQDSGEFAYEDSIKALTLFDFNSDRVFNIIDKYKELRNYREEQKELERIREERRIREQEERQRLAEERARQAEEERLRLLEEENNKVVDQKVRIELSAKDFEEIKVILGNLGIKYEIVE